jgi:hypothetical protein
MNSQKLKYMMLLCSKRSGKGLEMKKEKEEMGWTKKEVATKYSRCHCGDIL